MFALAGPWIDAVSEGRTIVVDEIWALHPTLLRHLIEMVHRAPGAQVILTTHDTNLLDLDLVRRDQVFFVEKDSSGRAFLFSLLDYRARKGEAIGKGYLAGRYGALPFLEDYSVG